MIGAAIEQVFRLEGARVLAGLIRRIGSFELAEDALQEACAKALEVWPRDGLPDRPAAWLTTVAQHRAVDHLRQQRGTAVPLDELPDLAAGVADTADEAAADAGAVEDDRLRLLFTCCHPALGHAAQVALALRTLCGLSTAEIARAHVEAEATTAQRLVRAKRKIAEARIPFEVPPRELLGERVASVLGVVYLVFNEGYLGTESPGLLRPDLCAEGIRLGRLVNELLPGHAEAEGLLGLMLLHDARRDARSDAQGQLVPLEEQDRALWHAARIVEGLAWLDDALARRDVGPFQLQAAIAALHARAATAADTDWPQIAALYAALHRLQPTAIVELNAAVATAMAEGVDVGLRWIDAISERGELADYHLVAAARADLLRRSGRHADAALAYAQALRQVRNPAERAYLERRLRQAQAGG